MSLARKLLLAMFLVSLTGSAFGAGTFASFNATTTNAGSTFATGTLALSNLKQGAATTCMSTNTNITGGTITGGNANSSCDALFTALAANKPGATATVGLTLKNEGNIAATSLQGYGSGVCSGTADTPNTGGGATATLYHGSGDLCSYMKIQVQETTTNSFGVAQSKCMYPVNGAAACGVTSGTLANFFSTVTSGAPMVVATTPIPAGVGGDRFVKITLDFPDSGTPGGENIYMGKVLSFAVTWVLNQ